MNYASRWARLLARAVDLIVFGLVVLVLGASGIVDLDNIDNPYTMDGLITGVVGLVYFGAPAAAFGATLGKMALGMRVVGHNGEKASCIAILIREVYYSMERLLHNLPSSAHARQCFGNRRRSSCRPFWYPY